MQQLQGAAVAAHANLPENDVSAVQPRGGHSCDEKLAAVGVGTGVGHRKHSGHLQRELNQERGSRLYSGVEGGGGGQWRGGGGGGRGGGALLTFC
jgi:hypothetical protein